MRLRADLFNLTMRSGSGYRATFFDSRGEILASFWGTDQIAVAKDGERALECHLTGPDGCACCGLLAYEPSVSNEFVCINCAGVCRG